LAHVVVTDEAVVTPVGVERAVEQLREVRQAAVVGVGPVGTQQVVVVVVVEPDSRRRLGSPELSERVRTAAGIDVAAVLSRPSLPVDIRHNSKIDRTALAQWAGAQLAGRG